MGWIVACFCGNTYTTPPNRCEVCGGSIDPFPAPTNGARRPPDERDADDAQNAHEDPDSRQDLLSLVTGLAGRSTVGEGAGCCTQQDHLVAP